MITDVVGLDGSGSGLMTSPSTSLAGCTWTTAQWGAPITPNGGRPPSGWHPSGWGPPPGDEPRQLPPPER